MNAIKVSGLYKMMKEQMQQGHGDYVVFVTDYEEANGYHALWYDGQTAEELGDQLPLFEENNCDLSCVENDHKKAYYLG